MCYWILVIGKQLISIGNSSRALFLRDFSPLTVLFMSLDDTAMFIFYFWLFSLLSLPFVVVYQETAAASTAG